MENKSNNSKSSEKEFKQKTKRIKKTKEIAFEALGIHYGNAMAVKNKNEKYVIVFLGNQICPVEFESIEEVRVYMDNNPYALLPIMCTIYMNEVNKLKK